MNQKILFFTHLMGEYGIDTRFCAESKAAMLCCPPWMEGTSIMQEHLSSAALGEGYGYYRQAASCLAAFIAMDGMYTGFAGAKTVIFCRKICVQLRNLGLS